MSMPSIPQSQKQWVVQDTKHGFDGMVFQKDAPIPKVGEKDVLVRMHGASLNFRDLIIPRVRTE